VAGRDVLTNNHMVGSILVLGFTLSLDTFRTAIAPGVLGPRA
jgi:hypothetical protein